MNTTITQATAPKRYTRVINTLSNKRQPIATSTRRGYAIHTLDDRSQVIVWRFTHGIKPVTVTETQVARRAIEFALEQAQTRGYFNSHMVYSGDGWWWLQVDR